MVALAWQAQVVVPPSTIRLLEPGVASFFSSPLCICLAVACQSSIGLSLALVAFCRSHHSESEYSYSFEQPHPVS